MWLTRIWNCIQHSLCDWKSICTNRCVNCGLLPKGSVTSPPPSTPTHTISNTHRELPFVRFSESVAQLSTLRSEVTVSLYPQLGLPTTWSMRLLLLTPGKAVQVDGSLTFVFVVVQHRLEKYKVLDIHRWNNTVPSCPKLDVWTNWNPFLRSNNNQHMVKPIFTVYRPMIYFYYEYLGLQFILITTYVKNGWSHSETLCVLYWCI